jgi:predicted Zn finger-like uncharacterized protein
MADEKYTSCPSCRTVFRVTQQQLELRGGRVRCGHCQSVFDGVAQLVVLAPTPEPDDDFDAFDELALGPPTVTLRSAQALGSPAEGAQGSESATPGVAAVEPAAADAAAGPAPVEPASVEPATADATADELAARAAPDDALPAPSSAADETAGLSAVAGDTAAPLQSADEAAPAPAPSTDGPPTAKADRPRRGLAPVAWAIAAPLLVLLLAGQATLHFRDLIGARFPAAKPALARLCALAGCTVGAPQAIENLAIVSDLQADPAHQGLLILTGSLRNRGAMPLAYPYLELVLTDTQDQVVVRRVLAPREFMGGTADLAAGIPANSEVPIKLFIDASATTQAGYRVYLFYV